MTSIRLPHADGRLEDFTLSPARAWPAPNSPPQWNRVAFAAAHVVASPLAAIDPWVDAAIDWDATLAYRRYLWSLGFGIAEAMDTAQRGMGLDWSTSLALIKRTVAEARDTPGAVVFSGAGTDHLMTDPDAPIDRVIGAYEEQCAAIEGAGGRIILMASRALAACAKSPDDYAHVYARVLAQVREPVIVHWLGEMFDPALAGYWIGAKRDDPDHAGAIEICADIIRAHAAKIDGIKISLLDDDKEIALRERLPPGVRMYTGDDFNFATLVGGDSRGHSDALLGIFDAVAPAASAALTALAQGDRATFDRILTPIVPLSRHIFAAPTRFYKTGIVFLAWLNGHQSHFTMIGGQQSARSVVHLAELFRLADKAGLLRNPDLATARMQTLLALHGLGAKR
jgi:uncharacterized protein DUF993